MQDFGLSKIMESIGNALHIFDFSFFISGAVTFFILVADVFAHNGIESLKWVVTLPLWIMVLSILLCIYVCGLISWMMGKSIRSAGVSTDGPYEDNAAIEDFCKTYDSLTESLHLGTQKLPEITNKKDIYYYMWIKLDSLQDNENVKGRLAYCNRLWVMQALFEGLLFSWIFAIIVLADVLFFTTFFQIHGIFYIFPLFFSLVIMAFFSHKTATNYANSQVKEIVIAYKVYVLEKNK